jgi:hypothetical protein
MIARADLRASGFAAGHGHELRLRSLRSLSPPHLVSATALRVATPARSPGGHYGARRGNKRRHKAPTPSHEEGTMTAPTTPWTIGEAPDGAHFVDLTPTGTIRTYTDALGHTQRAVDGPNGTWAITRQDEHSLYEVWKSDSLTTDYRDRDGGRALAKALELAGVEL